MQQLKMFFNDGDDTKIIEEDEIPDIPNKPKSTYGDIYQLGNHILMCGDSTNIDGQLSIFTDVEKMEQESLF